MQLVEVKPLAAFVGTYQCALADADILDDVLVERDGMVLKDRIPKKRIHGRVDIQRRLAPVEIEAALAGELPGNIELLDPGVLKKIKPGRLDTAPDVMVIEKAPTVKVPEEIAEDLIKRGLAVKVEPVGKRAKA